MDTLKNNKKLKQQNYLLLHRLYNNMSKNAKYLVVEKKIIVH